jgi:hypothetical protein
MSQLSGVFSLVDGNTCDYDSLFILSFGEEEGEIKMLDLKDFCDPEKRSGFYAGAAKAAAKGVAAS